MLDWLVQTWDRLNRTRAQDRLPHALLIIGADGVGKQLLARQLAGSLLCENPDDAGKRCGRCAACGWLQAGTHPDLLLVQPDEPGKAIKVDQVRALCSELAMTSHAGRYKVAIIQPANAMNANAANSLLKTLEEPTDNTLLMLLTASPGRLPATIRSRCQQVVLKQPDASTAQNWLRSKGIEAKMATQCLQLAGGAPLKALQLAESEAPEVRARCLEHLARVFGGEMDPIYLAKEWSGEHEAQILAWWADWIRELIRWQQAALPPAEAAVAQELRRIVESVDCRDLHKLADRVSNALNSMGTGLNQQLLLEDLLISWADLPRIDKQRHMVGSR